MDLASLPDAPDLGDLFGDDADVAPGPVVARIQVVKKAVPPPQPKQPDDRGDVMAAIKSGGFALKKVDRSAAAKPQEKEEGRGGMLAMIKNKNFALKKVDAAAEAEKKRKASETKSGLGAGFGNVMNLLAQRAAIKGSSESEESDGDWD